MRHIYVKITKQLLSVVNWVSRANKREKIIPFWFCLFAKWLSGCVCHIRSQGDFNKLLCRVAIHSWSCMSTVKTTSALKNKSLTKRRLMIDYQSCVYAMKVHAKLELHLLWLWRHINRQLQLCSMYYASGSVRCLERQAFHYWAIKYCGINDLPFFVYKFTGQILLGILARTSNVNTPVSFTDTQVFGMSMVDSCFRLRLNECNSLTNGYIFVKQAHQIFLWKKSLKWSNF